MGFRLFLCGVVACAAGGFVAGPSPAQSAIAPAAANGPMVLPALGSAVVPAARVPLEQVPVEVRDRIRGVLERPTLRTQGSAEVFSCKPAFYFWLLDHPDLAVRLWRGLGVQCADIQDRGEGRFAWQDGQGSGVTWTAVLRGPGQRVWYAEGRVKPGVLLPAVAVRAVVCLHHREAEDEAGRPLVRHQVELHLQTDSRAIALAARLVGASAPRLAEQYAGQIQTFYAALACYCDQNPAKARSLLTGLEQIPRRSERTGRNQEATPR